MTGSSDEAPGPDEGPDPDEVARISSGRMWAADRSAAGLGLRLLDVGPGYASFDLEITAAMANAHGVAHGGFVFALADSASAYACNSRGSRAVTQHCSITFLRPARLGDRLVATAHEVALAGRSGLYDVSVSCGDDTVAEFRGHFRLVPGSWLDGPEASSLAGEA